MKTPTETLHDCPACGGKNFTTKGLKAHNCKRRQEKAGALTVMPARNLRPVSLATLDAMPLAIIDTRDGWQRARHWAESAGNFERCKLACQVMTGFELLALKQAMGVKRGGDRTANPSDLGLLGTWEETVKARVGISDETARNWMAMAAKAQPRMKKLGGAEVLKEILARPASEWDAGELKAVQQTVAKITDGKTQLDFMRELGLERAAVKFHGGDSRKPCPHCGVLLKSTIGTCGKCGKVMEPYDPNSPVESARLLLLHPLRIVIKRWREKEAKLPLWAHLPPEELREIDGILLDLRTDTKAALKEGAAK